MSEVDVRRMVLAALIVVSSGISAHAQSIQLWPEISAFTRLNDRMRFYFLATTVREKSGVHGRRVRSEFRLLPSAVGDNPKHFGWLRLDESKNRFLLLRVGYRYLHSFSGSPDEHRTVLEATTRLPLAAGVLVSHRGRVDLRFIDGEDSWRFRSRLSVEKEVSIGRVRVNPYVRGELYYDSRVDEWSRTEWIGGAAFPLNRRVELEGYFDYQNDTGGNPNRQVSAIGAVLNLYF